MANMEQVEKLREKAKVTYDEAKAALDASDGDILEAIILLERQGKVPPPEHGGYYSSKSEKPPEREYAYRASEEAYRGETFSRLAGRFFKWCGRVIARGNANTFEVRRGDKTIISVPVTVLALLLVFAFWVVIPLLVIGLFFGCRYLFRGADLERTGVNRVMESAADTAERIKKDVRDGGNDR
ncbi:MAG: DUF4342 domain-containing protein [Clostridiales bacterium]|jgi:hypothetical protein|nr:DUF4342 domain-containing protein [Clostridiales bacterium]